MKIIALLALSVAGCASGPLPWAQGPQQEPSECTASCAAHFAQCPQIFAAFPERGAVECPAARDTCVRACVGRKDAAIAAPDASRRPLPPSNVPAASGKENRLRELKRWYEEGLVSEDVYKEQQRLIMAQP